MFKRGAKLEIPLPLRGLRYRKRQVCQPFGAERVKVAPLQVRSEGTDRRQCYVGVAVTKGFKDALER